MTSSMPPSRRDLAELPLEILTQLRLTRRSATSARSRPAVQLSPLTRLIPSTCPTATCALLKVHPSVPEPVPAERVPVQTPRSFFPPEWTFRYQKPASDWRTRP